MFLNCSNRFISLTAIGIDDDLNLCSGSLQESRKYSQEILDNIITPALDEDESQMSLEMGNNLLNGIQILNPYISVEAFKVWTKRRFGISNSDTSSFQLRIYLSIEEFLFSTLLTGPFGWFYRPIFNGLIKTNIYLGNLLESVIMVKERRKYWYDIDQSYYILLLRRINSSIKSSSHDNYNFILFFYSTAIVTLGLIAVFVLLPLMISKLMINIMLL